MLEDDPIIDFVVCLSNQAKQNQKQRENNQLIRSGVSAGLSGRRRRGERGGGMQARLHKPSFIKTYHTDDFLKLKEDGPSRDRNVDRPAAASPFLTVCFSQQELGSQIVGGS